MEPWIRKLLIIIAIVVIIILIISGLSLVALVAVLVVGLILYRGKKIEKKISNKNEIDEMYIKFLIQDNFVATFDIYKIGYVNPIINGHITPNKTIIYNIPNSSYPEINDKTIIENYKLAEGEFGKSVTLALGDTSLYVLEVLHDGMNLYHYSKTKDIKVASYMGKNNGNLIIYDVSHKKNESEIKNIFEKYENKADGTYKIDPYDIRSGQLKAK